MRPKQDAGPAAGAPELHRPCRVAGRTHGFRRAVVLARGRKPACRDRAERRRQVHSPPRDRRPPATPISGEVRLDPAPEDGFAGDPLSRPSRRPEANLHRRRESRILADRLGRRRQHRRGARYGRPVRPRPSARSPPSPPASAGAWRSPGCSSRRGRSGSSTSRRPPSTPPARRCSAASSRAHLDRRRHGRRRHPSRSRR